MTEIERVIKDLVRLLEEILEEVESVDEIEEVVGVITRELGLWFPGGVPLYQAS